MTIRDTSLLAYERKRQSLTLGSDWDRVLAILEEMGPMDDVGICNALNRKEQVTLKPKRQKRKWTINLITPRRGELVDMGMVKDLGRFKRPTRNRPVHIWRARCDSRIPAGWKRVEDEEVHRKPVAQIQRQRAERTEEIQRPILHALEYEVKPVEQVIAEDLIEKYHYARGGSNTRVFRHGLFKRGEPLNCLGIAWWIPPTKSCAQSSYDGDWRKVLMLSRFGLVPGMPKNAASFLLGRSIRLIESDGRWDCLLTYADEAQGHNGGIYKATNWEYVGQTNPEPMWIEPQSGRMVHRKAGSHTRTAKEMSELGYEHRGNFRKHKFRMILRSKDKASEAGRVLREYRKVNPAHRTGGVKGRKQMVKTGQGLLFG